MKATRKPDFSILLCILPADDDGHHYQYNKNNRQNDSNREEGFFYSAASAENTTGILTGEPAQADTLALQHNAYNQR